MFLDRMMGAAGLGTALLIVAGASAPPARAAVVVTLEQVGKNVVATESGTLDVTDLKVQTQVFAMPAFIFPSASAIITGAPSFATVFEFITPPVAFGTGVETPVSGSGGDLVGAGGDTLFVPANYVSGGALSGSAIWDGATFASLHVTPGIYVWTWGSGANADSFTLDAVPEPSTWALIGVGFLGLAGFGLLARAKHEQARLPG